MEMTHLFKIIPPPPPPPPPPPAVSPGVYVIVVASDSPESLKNIADYVCDGVDDQVEINNAIDRAVSEGKPVLLAPGTYKITGPIILKSNVRIIGYGSNIKTPLEDYGHNRFIYGYRVENVVIEGLTLIGDNVSGVSLITLQESTRSTIFRCKFIGGGDLGVTLGITLASSLYNVIINCEFVNTTIGIDIGPATASSAGIATTLPYLTNSGNIIYGNMFSNSTYGIFISESSFDTIIFNVFNEVIYSCISIYDSTYIMIKGNLARDSNIFIDSAYSSSINISHNIMINCDYDCIDIFSGGDNIISNNIMDGCFTAGCIYITESSRNMIVGNQLRRSYDYGIIIYGDSVNNILVSNDMCTLSWDILDSGEDTRRRSNIGGDCTWLADA